MLVDPHTQFCCSIHGCRFNNNELCPIVKKTALQLNKCGESAVCSEYIGHSNERNLPVEAHI